MSFETVKIWVWLENKYINFKILCLDSRLCSISLQIFTYCIMHSAMKKKIPGTRNLSQKTCARAFQRLGFLERSLLLHASIKGLLSSFTVLCLSSLKISSMLTVLLFPNEKIGSIQLIGQKNDTYNCNV